MEKEMEKEKKKIFQLNVEKGKEYYDNGKLKFEGEYLNGKRWNGKYYNIKGNVCCKIINGTGKVKEYNEKGNIIFEGEYSNGEINGKCKEYFNNGKLIFEGEYLNGIKWNGKCKEYDNFNDKLIFEGEYLNGEKKNA